MPTVQKKKVQWVQAKETFVGVLDARPVEWHRRIVRNRHTGKLEEIDIHELGPKVEEVLGTSYCFKRGERVHADHVAVLAWPDHFIEAYED